MLDEEIIDDLAHRLRRLVISYLRNHGQIVGIHSMSLTFWRVMARRMIC